MRYTTNPYTADPLSIRIGRTTFLLRGMLLLCAALLASLLLSAADRASLVTQIVCIGGGVSLLVFLFVSMFRFLFIPRLRDIGVHPAWSLLFFVHALSGLFLLALLLIPTNACVGRRPYFV